MGTEIVPIPPIPPGLREASLIDGLRLFIGAGASQLAGCPGWEDFADDALRQLVNSGQFTYSHFEQVKHLNPRVKLSIALTLAEDGKAPIDFDAILHPGAPAKHPNGQRLYRSLFALGNIFVTTNYDRWLDRRIAEPATSAAALPNPSTPSSATPMRSIYHVNDFRPALLTQPNTVVHLHGSVDDQKSMILTTRDYVKRYANDHRTGDASLENRALTFLEHLFAHYTVLFVGYGLGELEILEYVILKAKPQTDAASKEARHYLLQGYFSHEAALLRRMETYYLRECGIQLIPYLRDHKDHEQLLEVLENFAQNIPASSPLILRQQHVLEELAGEMESPQ
jgi:hypothetical protein